ncbi:MurR/RpiR family transcriptional regulator [Caballeronia sp. INDeC2]|uniref:MurR/RpiR family transcriptional regulator n=1 Tax=Caballeronia sp. INDeC2 TaxID=2921747 RepID=UPI002028761B|nr:MurR/RpiR family transcriptional regulator [Caballeronia sp. INDeC2]
MRLPIEDRLKEIYEELPYSERVLADLLIDFPGVLATHSISELVQRANTSNAAATRLVKRLGYKNAQEIRKQVREARENGSPRYLNTFVHDTLDFESSVKQHVDFEIQNLLQSFSELEENTLKEIVTALAQARNIWIVGYGNSHMTAMYLRQQLIQLREYVEVLPRSGQAIEKDLSGLRKQDMVVIVGFRRRSEIRYKLLQYARSVEATILYVTDHSEPKTNDLANWTVRCRVQSTSLFDSYTSAYSILNYICASLTDHLGRAASNRLAQAERLHELIRSQ